jgi:hypothetical protein
MNKLFCLTLVGVVAANLASAQFVINSSPGLFDPSFRGAANTTWFGWGSGSFDGASNNELIDNPATTIGLATPGASLTQSTAFDILSSGNNIYTSTAGATDLLLTLPTSGTLGSGFTTIIVQGKTAFGGFDIAPAFHDIAGVSPIFEVGSNAAAAAQFWAKYDIAGNLSSYDLAITLAAASFTSIAELEVDTYWSAAGFATETAVVPEPSALALVGLGSCAVFARKQRSRKNV